ncbi:MAG: PIG-L family deacetylase [Anaerolineae bacterium]|nr:PIG-L family deacetylase [Anaerolineae bacterium]
MLKTNFESIHRVLCLGAHSDDIEIGCGGTILKLIEDHPDIEFYWVVFSGSAHRTKEAERSASLFLENVSKKQIVVKDFRDGFFPYVGYEIKEYFEELKRAFVPDLVFTHYRHDLHQDHRLICELTWNTWRDHLILEYEIPKYDGDLGQPNFFVHLSEATCRRKIAAIHEAFESQRDNQWFTEETFLAILRLRGIESNAPEKYAEGFHCRKIAW